MSDYISIPEANMESVSSIESGKHQIGIRHKCGGSQRARVCSGLREITPSGSLVAGKSSLYQI